MTHPSDDPAFLLACAIAAGIILNGAAALFR